MKRKAKALANSGIIPVSGNEEPGVVAQQSSNSSCVLPIKKRYSMLYTRAPINPDRSFSNENESKTKDSGLNLMKANPNTSSIPSRNVEDVVKPALADKLAGQEAIGITKVSVVVAKQGESHSKVELPADSGHVELSLGPKKPHFSSLVDPNTKESCLMRGSVNPSLNKGKDISQEGSCKSGLNNIDDSAFINRCYWDLNTSMDLWIQDLAQIDLNSSLDTKPPPISSASVIASNADKGKQFVGASDQEFKSEAVGETLVQANAGTAIRPSGAFEANMQSSELLEQKPVKCEPIQEEISDVIAPQSVGRVLQRQESSSSSSTPSDHTNEANWSKNARHQANAVKNANFDLKEVNVSSNKVEASVSTSKNIEDHKVYKKTHNLVANGEGSAKISISAGTEEECYESDAHHAFVGHVDTVSEDEEYEDGEIREPMMQSIGEGMDSGDNNESSSKKVHTDKEETTGDDEQKPIGAIYNVTFSSNFLPVSSTGGRKIYYFLEEDKFHRRRNRFQDRSCGSSRRNFMRGRGRGRGRGRNFESYGDVADYRFRHKRTAPWLNGAAFASNRRRKPLNDAFPSFRHRLSPNGREDASMMAPRNITAEDSSAFVGLRHREKFNRDFPADISDPVYSHQQSMYDGPDGHFVHGNSKFSARQRSRGFPRMQSISPVRSRTWSSRRRRLTEGFNDHQDSYQHRSPVVYRRDGPRTSFTEEGIAPQRHDSPSYNLNHTSDVDAVQEHGHPRSHSSRRSLPGRFPELLSSDERRKYGEGQMRNVEGGQSEQFRHEEEFDVSRLKKRRF